MSSELISIAFPKNAIDELRNDDVEVLKLQDHCIKTLNSDYRELETKYSFLVEQLANVNLELAESEVQCDALTERIATLVDANTELKAKIETTVDAGELEALMVENQRNVALIDMNKTALKKITKECRDHERHIADLNYRLGISERERLELSEQSAKNATTYSTMKADFDGLTADLSITKKNLLVAQAEIDGFPRRLDNACAAAVAKYRESLAQPVFAATSTPSPIIVSNDECERLKSEVASLKDEVSELSRLNDLLTESNALFVEAQAGVDEQSKTMSRLSSNIVKDNTECERYGKECAKQVGVIQAENILLSKENVFLSEVNQYLGGRRIISCADGTTVFMLPNDFSECLKLDPNVSDEANPHPDYPLFWAILPNGVGHMFSLSKNMDNLLLPINMDSSYLISDENRDEILEAIKKMPVAKYREQFNRDDRRSMLIAQNIEWIDEAFSRPSIKIADFIRESVNRNLVSQELADKINADFKMIQNLSSRHAILRKAQTKNRQERERTGKKLSAIRKKRGR